jgi:TonB family protein
MRAREQGTVAVVLDIAAEGRVTNCTITASSRSTILDATTCRILRARARFTPARDASGKAVADRFETKLTWRMNASAPLVPPAVHAAMTSWSQCIGPMLAKGIGNKALSARAIAERAFAPCRAEEDRMLAVIREAVDAPRPIEQDRALLRQQVVDRIEAARTARQP